MFSFFRSSSKILRPAFVITKLNYYVHRDPITISNIAISKMKNIIIDNNKTIENAGIKLSAKKKECGGYVYALQCIDKMDMTIKIDENIIKDNVTVFVDNNSSQHIVGTDIDYVNDGIFSKFIFKNSNSAHKCECNK